MPVKEQQPRQIFFVCECDQPCLCLALIWKFKKLWLAAAAAFVKLGNFEVLKATKKSWFGVGVFL